MRFAGVFIAITVAMLALTPSASANQASRSIVGEWSPPNMDAVIRIKYCGQNLCANLVRHSYAALTDRDVKNPSESLRRRPLIGLRILDNLRMSGEKKWRDGALYDPRTGRTYWSKLKVLDTNRLKITACIGPGLCKGYIWKRADARDGAELPSGAAKEQISTILSADSLYE